MPCSCTSPSGRSTIRSAPRPTVYLYVADADAVHSEWERAGVDGRLTEPTDTPYGLREFAFVDTDGTLHRVGSPLAHARR